MAVLFLLFLSSLCSAQWYPFAPRNDPAPGEIGMQSWLEKPAGHYGRIEREGDKLLYHGKPIKLWGLNLCFADCAPKKALADKRALFYAKYGINAVRLHKYGDGSGWSGIQSPDSFVQFDPEGLDRMDYQVAQFKQQGITVLLSPIFGSQKLGRGDRQYVPYLEEFGSFDGKKNRITTPHSAVHYSLELQDVQIRQMVNLLQHRNPYTGLTYAADPAVAFLEIINEQSILFYTSMTPLKASATLRRDVAQRFCDWLRDQYGSHAGLMDAWGEKALGGFEKDGFNDDEHLDRNNILPLGNPWYWDPEQLNGSQAYRRQRLLDTLVFLYEQQCAFYDRYVAAVRTAGYEGEVLGSNWQAGRAVSHYYNLHSDYRVGTIDRHNYFGGGRKGPFDAASMLTVPGSGMLSVGMQQVVDRPFMLSEWIHVFPNEWGVEGPALIGAYGMGLQGWDVSYLFQNRDRGGFSDRVGRDQWDVTAPQVLGIFPAVARQVLRGDVSESTVTAVRQVSLPALRQGKLDFEDSTKQQHDVKSFDSDKVPAATLAVARSVVTFTEGPAQTPTFDLSPYRDGNRFRSSTHQLVWHGGAGPREGFVTIDTPGTCALIGFAQGHTANLRDVTITSQSRFGAVYVTVRDAQGSLATSDALLIVALARARNTGMKLSESEDELLERGQPPVLLEPVKATIRLERGGQPTVTLLDHDGVRTETTLPVKNGVLQIDGERDRTPYYLVEYKRRRP